jgi:hypothetical protein
VNIYNFKKFYGALHGPPGTREETEGMGGEGKGKREGKGGKRPSSLSLKRSAKNCESEVSC